MQIGISRFARCSEHAAERMSTQHFLLSAVLVLCFAIRPMAANASTDAEIASVLQRRFSCSVLVPDGTQAGQVRGAGGSVQAFMYGAEGCPRLPFSGSSFAVAVPRVSGLTILLPQPVQTGVTGIVVRDGHIVTTSLDYAPSDPRCCPSRRMTQRWIISGERLVRAP